MTMPINLTLWLALAEIVLLGTWALRTAPNRVWLFSRLPGFITLAVFAAVMDLIHQEINGISIVGLVTYSAAGGWRLRDIAAPLILKLPRPLRRVILRAPGLQATYPVGVVMAALAIATVSASSISAITTGLALLGLVVTLLTLWRLQQLAPLPTIPTVTFIVILVAAALAAGSFDGSLKWMAAPERSNALTQVVAVQLVLGVIPIAVAVGVAQVSTGWLGLRARAALRLRSTIAVLVGLLASLTLDIFLLGKQDAQVTWLQLSEVLAWLLILGVLAAMWELFSGLRPEVMTAKLVRRLNNSWVGWLGTTYQHFPWPVLERNDPFDAVERLLFQSIRYEESQLFREALFELEQRIEQIAFESSQQGAIRFEGPSNQTEIVLDLYFSRRLEALVDAACREQLRWAIRELIVFRQRLEMTATDWQPTATGAVGNMRIAPAILGGDSFSAPSGTRFYALLANACLGHDLDEEASIAVARMAGYLRRALSHLPAPDGIFELVGSVSQAPEAPIAQGIVDGVNGYLRVLNRLSEAAAARHLEATLRSISRAPRDILSNTPEIENLAWARWLTRKAIQNGYLIALAAAEHEELAYSLPALPRKLTTVRDGDQMWAAEIQNWVPETLREISPLSLEYFLVVDAAMLALYLLPDFPETAAALAGTLERLRKSGESLALNRDQRAALAEIPRRIEQIRRGSEGSWAAFDAAYAAYLAG